jgi:rifampicin phosphotransferase
MPDPIIFLSSTCYEPNLASSIGGKAARLIELSRGSFSVPRFFVVAAHAFDDCIEEAGLKRWLDEELRGLNRDTWDQNREVVQRIGERLSGMVLPIAFATTLRETHRQIFFDSPPLAVRSSIAEEDSTAHSFAGLHDSVLGARTIDDLMLAIRRVWASAFSERALFYRLQRDISLVSIRPAVIVQELVLAKSSGVMFTRHPIAARKESILIHATFGLGTELVGGQVEGDSFLMDRKELRTTPTLVCKTHRWIFDPSRNGLLKQDIPLPEREQSSLSDNQLHVLGRIALDLENRFGTAQDIEFCCDDAGDVWVLQSRDALARSAVESVLEDHRIWDNSNIAESYSGITLPLTFSFIRRVYAIVYHCFAEVMGVSPNVIQTHRRLYENLLGSIQGRVYYNLKSWYFALALLPGFEYNREFLETMMGVSESLSLDERRPQSGWFRRWFIEFPALIRTLMRSIWNLTRVNWLTDQFLGNFRRHYAEWSQIDFRKLSPCQIQSQYERLEDALLWNWKAPIIGDFHVMIFFGLLKKLCERWCCESGLQNELIRGTGGIESAAPAHELLDLARLAMTTSGLSSLILEKSDRELQPLVEAEPAYAEFGQRFRQYIELYGFRCPEELKLESLSLWDEPSQLYGVLRNYLALNQPELFDISAIQQRDVAARQEAERRAFHALDRVPGWIPRKTFFRWVLMQARNGVRNRENMRFARTRVFGLIREMIRSVGHSFQTQGFLHSADDIFYLTMEEIWDFVKGTAVTTDLCGLVDVRRREYSGYAADAKKPADRFETFGIVYGNRPFQNQASPDHAATDKQPLAGIGCCAGIATGPVCCLTHPHHASGVQGTILVGRHMDAGWVTLFPLVQGILVERGSILSHAAVIARELGVPTIVAIPGLMSKLETGTTVRMDGQAGTVEILSTSSTRNR